VSIPRLEILRTETADERILSLFQKHKELAVFQMVEALGINRNTLENALRRLSDSGKLKYTKMLVRRSDKSTWVNVYSIK